MSAQDERPVANGERGYEWPCKQCGRIFTPRRLDNLPNSPYAKCCATCALKNLMAFLAEDDSETLKPEAKA